MTSKLADAQALIDTERLWRTHSADKDFLVGVKVLAAQHGPFGRIDVQIEPLSGRGTRWVDVDSTQAIGDD